MGTLYAWRMRIFQFKSLGVLFLIHCSDVDEFPKSCIADTFLIARKYGNEVAKQRDNVAIRDAQDKY